MKLFKRKKDKILRRKLSLDEILSLFNEKGQIIEGEDFLQTLGCIEEFILKGGLIASTPSITYLRNEQPLENNIWAQDLDSASSEYLGRDKNGLFGKKEERFVLTTHNLKLPTTKSLTGYNKEIKMWEKGINYSLEIFDNLLRGKTPQDEDLKLFHIEDFFNENEKQNKRFGILTPLKMIKKEKVILGQSNYLSEPLARARGGVSFEAAGIYTEKLMKKSRKNYKFKRDKFLFTCNHNYFEDPLELTQKQILYLSSLGISTGQNIRENPHRFLAARYGSID